MGCWHAICFIVSCHEASPRPRERGEFPSDLEASLASIARERRGCLRECSWLLTCGLMVIRATRVRRASPGRYHEPTADHSRGQSSGLRNVRKSREAAYLTTLCSDQALGCGKRVGRSPPGVLRHPKLETSHGRAIRFGVFRTCPLGIKRGWQMSNTSSWELAVNMDSPLAKRVEPIRIGDEHTCRNVRQWKCTISEYEMFAEVGSSELEELTANAWLVVFPAGLARRDVVVIHKPPYDHPYQGRSALEVQNHGRRRGRLLYTRQSESDPDIDRENK